MHIPYGIRRAASVVHESEVTAHERVTRPRRGKWTEEEEDRLGVRGEGTLYLCTCEGDEERRGYARGEEDRGGESRQSTRPHRDSNSIAGIAGQAISHSHVLNIDC